MREGKRERDEKEREIKVLKSDTLQDKELSVKII